MLPVYTQITKKSVDRCGTKEPYSVCIIRVSATSNADSELSYDIPLVGADDNITITISRTINDLGMRKSVNKKFICLHTEIDFAEANINDTIINNYNNSTAVSPNGGGVANLTMH